MFSFFKKKAPPPTAEPAAPPAAPDAPAVAPAPAITSAVTPAATPVEAPAPRSRFSPSNWFGGSKAAPEATPAPPSLPPTEAPAAAPAPPPAEPLAPAAFPTPDAAAAIDIAAPVPLAPPVEPVAPVAPPLPAQPLPRPPAATAPAPQEPERQGWMNRLTAGLKKTGSGIQAVFVNAQIDDALYDELEDALLMADTGIPATTHILQDLKDRVWRTSATTPAAVRAQLVESVAAVLKPLEKPLEVGRHTPTVIMVAGVNGAGKTTSIGKLTKHLANAGCTVLLAAADTFRAAAREQLAIWADRNLVEIVSQEGGDPSAVSFDAVNAGRARGKDVVLVDTAGRLPTQLHLMDELKKIKRTIGKAGGQQANASGVPPHEILLVIDGNTGQNALNQVQAFDEALGLTGLVVTKLDGTAKGGVLCAIARWGAERAGGPVPVYFIGVGEKLEDLETFDAHEFAQALLG